jgi:hypothetical protein
LETLSALVLFAMSTATLGDFLVSQIRAAGSNDSHVVAFDLGIEELEDLSSLPYNQIVPRTAETQKGGMLYAVMTRVEDDVPGSGMKRITVEVEWNEPGGTRHVSLETINSTFAR